MRNFVRKFRKDEEGAAMVEYAVLLGIITAASIATIALIGTQISTIFTTVNTVLATALA